MNLDPPEPPPGKPHTAAAWTSSGCERWPRAPLVVAKLSPGAGGTRRSGKVGGGGPGGGRGRRRGLESSGGGGGRGLCVHVCACVCRLGTAAGTDSARIAPRPGLLRSTLRSALGAPGRGDGGAASRPCGALPGLGPHPCQPGGQTRTPGRGGGPRGWKHVLKWSELTLNDAPGLDNPYLEYLMWLPLLLNARHLTLQDLTF